MRTLYLLASYLLTPLLLLHLAWRGLRNRAFLRRWGERFGWYKHAVPPGGIVVHAASVGEVNAAAPLIRALARQYSGLPITVTSFTPTGSDRIQTLLTHNVFHVYLPLDLPGAVRRFFRYVRPCLLIIMETEIWPNLYFAAARSGIPILLANARISEASMPRYRRMRRLTRATLAHVARIGAQSAADARRLCELGAKADRVEVTGNLKFDLNMADGLHEQGRCLRQSWGRQRPVLLAASTHAGDEEPVLSAFLGLLQSFPQALLILVPRHPQRFQPAARSARAIGLAVQLHSEGAACAPTTQCLVVDTMGALLRFYAACDVAFVGGSLDRIGGHNVLEPAALSIPVLVGPHTFNFTDITGQLLASGGAQRVNDAAELERAAARLLGDETLRRQMGAAGLALVRSGQGALSRTLHIIEEMLDQFNS
jgi:3-deoxy-D-manno-octulosonic-acid transferase